MVRISHTVALAPVPRPWLVDALGTLTDLAESTTAEDGRVLLPDGRQVPDVRPAGGRHLRPGAAYESTEKAADTVRITVEEWRRTRAVRLAFTGSGPDGDLTGRAALFAPDRPDRVELSGRAVLRSVPSPLSRFDADAELSCADWWKAADRGGSVRRPPLRARLTCGVARAEVAAVPRPGRDHGGWDVTVTVRLRGRGPLRPLVSLALHLTRRPLAREVAKALDDTARDWNAQVPQLTALGPGELHRKLLTEP
ncbi:hypothetical protein ACFU0X_34405 [Streptomyces cellulosae]|uniref:SRPBCC family protein n=1 Tax=Streptomyces cellulosae TaxID=1968 RepID=A0ABW6JUQ1_STRCE